MKDNLLLALSKYRPREGHTPLENFITEAFAWLLRSDDNFACSFFKHFCKENISPRNMEINTQLNLDGNFPDMVISIDSRVWIFEHKTFTRLSSDQLTKYRDSANKRFGSAKIVLITGFKSQHEQYPDIALTWCDIYEFLRSFVNPNSSVFFTYFSELLKGNGLGPQPALSYESIIYYLPSKDFRVNLEQILWKAYETIEKTNRFDFFYTALEEDKSTNLKWNGDVSKFWGRVGTEYLRIWRPGVFIGCIVDNTDHGNNYMDYSKGIDYSLIFSFDQEKSEDNDMKCYGKIDYEQDEVYNQLLSEISRDDLYGFEVYEHARETEPNRWHPLYVRKSLSDVLVGLGTQEEQVSKLLDESERMLRFLVNCKSFLSLRQKYKILMPANEPMQPTSYSRG